LDDLAATMQVMSEDEQRRYVGGADSSYYYGSGIERKIEGGRLVETSDGVTYYSYGGDCIFFKGVKISNSSLSSHPYQLNGTIYLPGSGYKFDDILHEYGHYIQQQEMGGLRYFFEVAIPSVGSAIYDDITRKNLHLTRSFEVEASGKGDYYFQENFNGCY
jgi:hypothetical protein